MGSTHRCTFWDCCSQSESREQKETEKSAGTDEPALAQGGAADAKRMGISASFKMPPQNACRRRKRDIDNSSVENSTGLRDTKASKRCRTSF